MAQILVTGGAGFLGSHLCERLLERGDHVICVDNFFSGRKENIDHLRDHKQFELIRHDIVHPLYVEAEQIYNLACPASPVAYQYNPIKTIKTSTVGMINVLGLARRCRARIACTSTSEVYGDPEVHPQKEDYWGPDQPSGRRRAARRREAGRRIPVHELPPGPRDPDPDRPDLQHLWAADGSQRRPASFRTSSCRPSRGESLTVYGHGKQTRSFCYVDDPRRRADPDDGPEQPTSARSTSATRSRTCSSWPGGGPRADQARSRRSSSTRSPKTTRSSGGRTSPRPRRSSSTGTEGPSKEGLAKDDRVLPPDAVPG